MHPECRTFAETAVQRCGLRSGVGSSVLEFGSLDIHGGVRDLLPGKHYAKFCQEEWGQILQSQLFPAS